MGSSSPTVAEAFAQYDLFPQERSLRRGFAAWVFWLIITAATTKYIIQYLDFDYPVTIATIQAAVATIGTRVAGAIAFSNDEKDLPRVRRRQWKWLGLTSITLAAIIVVAKLIHENESDARYGFMLAFVPCLIVVMKWRTGFIAVMPSRGSLLLLGFSSLFLALSTLEIMGGEQVLGMLKMPAVMPDGLGSIRQGVQDHIQRLKEIDPTEINFPTGLVLVSLGITLEAVFYFCFDQMMKLQGAKGASPLFVLTYFAPLALMSTFLAAWATEGDGLRLIFRREIPRTPLLLFGVSGSMVMYSAINLISMIAAHNFALINTIVLRFMAFVPYLSSQQPTHVFSFACLGLGVITATIYTENDLENYHHHYLVDDTASSAASSDDDDDEDTGYDKEAQSPGHRFIPLDTSMFSTLRIGALALVFFFVMTKFMNQIPDVRGTKNIKTVDEWGYNITTGLNYTKVATLLETRNVPDLSFIIAIFLRVLPKDWPMVIWGSDENIPYLSRSALLLDDIKSGRLNLTKLPDGTSLTGRELVSRFLTRPWFYEQFHPHAEWMLLFQHDSVLCSGTNQSIEDWLGYDFIGAPNMWARENRGGNGGLCIRKISTFREITHDPARTRPDGSHMQEDEWIKHVLEQRGSRTRWPTKNQGLFSASVDLDVTDSDEMWQPVGLHRGMEGGPALWNNETRFARLAKYCPEAQVLRWNHETRPGPDSGKWLEYKGDAPAEAPPAK